MLTLNIGQQISYLTDQNPRHIVLFENLSNSHDQEIKQLKANLYWESTGIIRDAYENTWNCIELKHSLNEPNLSLFCWWRQKVEMLSIWLLIINSTIEGELMKRVALLRVNLLKLVNDKGWEWLQNRSNSSVSISQVYLTKRHCSKRTVQ